MKKIEDRLNLTKEQLKTDYLNLESLRAVAKKYNTDHGTIKRAFIRLNINYRKENYKTASVNNDFFSNINVSSCYWAGFIMADGCVHKNILSINISSKDLAHLERFKKDISYEGNIYTAINKLSKINKNWKDVKMSRVSIYSKKIVNDLKKFNITPRKTFNTEFPTHLPKNLIHCFCRGYFDGDGTFCLHKAKSRPNTKPQLVFGLRGTKQFLREFNNIMVNEADLPKRCFNKKISESQNIGSITYCGNNICTKIAKWLYQNPEEVFLKRKFNIIKDNL